MNLKQFAAFEDDDKLWVYIFDRALDEGEGRALEGRLREFTASWKSHDKEVRGTYAIYKRQIVLLAVKGGISGCSIDSSVRLFKEFKISHGADALNRNWVFFIDQNREIQKASRAQFAELVQKGSIKNDTLVIDGSITQVGELRFGGLEKPFSQSWHKNTFSQPLSSSPPPPVPLG